MAKNYPGEHMLLQWTGQFDVLDPQGQTIGYADNFVGSLRFAGPGIDAVDNDATLDRIVPVFRAAWGDANMHIPGQAEVTTLKWNRLDSAGHYANPASTRLREDLKIYGYGSPAFPNTVAAVVTWTTGARRGLAKQGRTYFPTRITMDSRTFQIAQTAATQLAHRAASFIYELNRAINNGVITGGVNDGNSTSDPTSGVVAQVMSGEREGMRRVITGTRVGLTYDTQRRRRNMLPENYLTQTVGPFVPVP